MGGSAHPVHRAIKRTNFSINLIGLESMLNSIYARRRMEGEVQWLRRALKLINSRVNFQAHVPSPSGVDFVEHIIKSQ